MIFSMFDYRIDLCNIIANRITQSFFFFTSIKVKVNVFLN